MKKIRSNHVVIAKSDVLEKRSMKFATKKAAAKKAAKPAKKAAKKAAKKK